MSDAHACMRAANNCAVKAWHQPSSSFEPPSWLHMRASGLQGFSLKLHMQCRHIVSELFASHLHRSATSARASQGSEIEGILGVSSAIHTYIHRRLQYVAIPKFVRFQQDRRRQTRRPQQRASRGGHRSRWIQTIHASTLARVLHLSGTSLAKDLEAPDVSLPQTSLRRTHASVGVASIAGTSSSVAVYPEYHTTRRKRLI
jgi:hypothetical protein